MDERPDQRVLLRVNEAAAFLSLSRSKTYQLVAAGQIPSLRIGGSVRVPRAALEAWVEQNTAGPRVA